VFRKDVITGCSKVLSHNLTLGGGRGDMMQGKCRGEKKQNDLNIY
jgi:hypothetical protein